jgi:hypothetical protein
MKVLPSKYLPEDEIPKGWSLFIYEAWGDINALKNGIVVYSFDEIYEVAEEYGIKVPEYCFVKDLGKPGIEYVKVP